MGNIPRETDLFETLIFDKNLEKISGVSNYKRNSVCGDVIDVGLVALHAFLEILFAAKDQL